MKLPSGPSTLVYDGKGAGCLPILDVVVTKDGPKAWTPTGTRAIFTINQEQATFNPQTGATVISGFWTVIAEDSIAANGAHTVSGVTVTGRNTALTAWVLNTERLTTLEYDWHNPGTCDRVTRSGQLPFTIVSTLAGCPVWANPNPPNAPQASIAAGGTAWLIDRLTMARQLTRSEQVQLDRRNSKKRVLVN